MVVFFFRKESKIMDKLNKVILSRNPNKKRKRELNNTGRAGDYNGFQCGYGKHKTSKKDISRSQRKKEDREFTLRFSS